MGRDGAAKGVAKREAVDAKPCSDRGLGTGDRAREVRETAAVAGAGAVAGEPEIVHLLSREAVPKTRLELGKWNSMDAIRANQAGKQVVVRIQESSTCADFSNLFRSPDERWPRGGSTTHHGISAAK